ELEHGLGLHSSEPTGTREDRPRRLPQGQVPRWSDEVAPVPLRVTPPTVGQGYGRPACPLKG
ncbi:MAG: hypothetical protein LH624_10760, partial [Cryobacterium sp.]|nr:hypothetical protein [Cryobacterium sp.]